MFDLDDLDDLEEKEAQKGGDKAAAPEASDEKMTLYWSAVSPPSRAVLGLVHHLGKQSSIEIKELNLGAGEHMRPPYSTLNPNMGVPALAIGEGSSPFVITEAAAIMRYLGNTCGNESIMPTDPRKAARVDEMISWFLSLFNFYFNYLMIYPQTYPMAPVHGATDGKSHDILIAKGKQKAPKFLKTLDTWLGQRKYVSGDTLTIADIFGVMMMTPGDQVGQTYEKYTNLSRWLTEMKGKDFYKKVIDQSKAGLAKVANPQKA